AGASAAADARTAPPDAASNDALSARGRPTRPPESMRLIASLTAKDETRNAGRTAGLIVFMLPSRAWIPLNRGAGCRGLRLICEIACSALSILHPPIAATFRITLLLRFRKAR